MILQPAKRFVDFIANDNVCTLAGNGIEPVCRVIVFSLECFSGRSIFHTGTQ